jgi:hypothetical protein
MTSLYHGDMCKAASLAYHEDVCRQVLIGNNPILEQSGPIFQRSRILNHGEDLCFLFNACNPSDPNSALICHIQVTTILCVSDPPQAGSSLRNSKNDALRLLIAHIMKEPLFTELRTRQQLGYVVSLFDDFYGRSA